MEMKPKKFIHKSDFEGALSDLGFRLGQADTPSEALLITIQVEALVKEMKAWVDTYQAEETEWKKIQEYAAELKRRGKKVPLKVEGDPLSILERAKIAADKGGWTKEQWDEYVQKAVADGFEDVYSQAFSNFLRVTLEYFDWEKGKAL